MHTYTGNLNMLLDLVRLGPCRRLVALDCTSVSTPQVRRGGQRALMARSSARAHCYDNAAIS